MIFCTDKGTKKKMSWFELKSQKSKAKQLIK